MVLNKKNKVLIEVLVFVFIIAATCDASSDSEQPIISLKFTPNGPESSDLIHFRFQNDDSVKHYTDKIDKFLERYSEMNIKHMRCDYDTPPGNGKLCFVDVASLGRCTAEHKYGFTRASPCVFLTLDNINNWNPEFYNDTNNLPAEMPEHIKTHIKQLNDPKLANNVWVSCEGENSADKESIGPVQYYPQFGFPGYFFPIRNVDGYLLPIVAVSFERMQSAIVVNIECKAWAYTIIDNNMKKIGSARFSILIDY